MLRLKSIFAALVLVAMTGVATAQTPYKVAACTPGNAAYKAGTPVVKLVIAGSSAMWTTMALGAYNSGKGVAGSIANTHHYVSSAAFNLVDARPLALGGTKLTDTGTVWMVWDEHTLYVAGTGTTCAPNVWLYLNTDSVVGNRAIFGSVGSGSYGVYVEAPATFPAPQDTTSATSFTIPPAEWGSTSPAGGGYDDVVPANIQALFTSANEGVANAPNLVNVGASDIRPEDAFFAITRANSVLGGTSADQRDGLGYVSAGATGPNSTTPGAAPANCTGTTPGATVADLVGSAIKGQETNGANNSTGSASSFNVAAFNITGQDPFTCATIPAMHVLPVGATPIIFIHSNNGSTLSGLTNATEAQLGTVFSGANHNASVFGLPSANFAVMVREPLSGTYNTTEETVMRHPSSTSLYRYSMETGVNPAVDNPLNGNGGRYRAIGTGREVNAVKTAFTNYGVDGIGFTFFSYGNVATLGGSSNYSYITLNGVDPIWHNYVPGTNGINDPGQAGLTPGQLPYNTPCGSASAIPPTAFPCPESSLWSADPSYTTVGITNTPTVSYSFPNVRNGAYPSWSAVRLIAGPAWINANALVTASNVYAVTTTPDYIPYVTVKSGTTIIDPGLNIVRSHYGCTLVTCGLNVLGTAINPPFNSPEKGRDAGGQILPRGDLKVNFTQDGFGFVLFQ